MAENENPGYGQKLDHSEFITFKTRLTEINGHLQTNVRHLQTLIGMVGAGWQGAGAGAFQRAQNGINNDHHAINKLLAGLIEAAHTTQKLGVGNDDEILASFKQIDVNGSADGGHLNPDSGLSGINAGLDGGGGANFDNRQVSTPMPGSKLNGM
ncbi:WXG100 family type VII secretion target [Streptomyces qinglanensis]|uniref:WXG100 family type VII secretion target n=1 Tax=Streptomyces qinglanensis TaxID=943816 RepID=UPI00085BF97E|nr:WXG100 family type VII secretion target [Streptomyces qinglanensis]MBE9500523.1 WXG100 family type VII secretion target [Streptomyces sp. GKU 257-1]